MSDRFGKVLRVAAIVLMGLTSVFTLLGGVGTSCVAWNAGQYGQSFAALVPYMTVYQILVFVSVIAAVVGIVATYGLVRGDKRAYAGAIAALVVGLAAAAIQMYYTSTLKGKSFFDTPPTSMRFYITLLTLVVFLIIRLPGIWDRVGLGRPQGGPGSKMGSGGLSMLLAGMVTLATPVWAGPSHMLEGYNLVNVLYAHLMVGGGLLSVAGVTMLFLASLRASRPAATPRVNNQGVCEVV